MPKLFRAFGFALQEITHAVLVAYVVDVFVHLVACFQARFAGDFALASATEFLITVIPGKGQHRKNKTGNK